MEHTEDLALLYSNPDIIVRTPPPESSNANSAAGGTPFEHHATPISGDIPAHGLSNVSSTSIPSGSSPVRGALDGTAVSSSSPTLSLSHSTKREDIAGIPGH